MTDHCKPCDRVGTDLVECASCRRDKAPLGRSASMESHYCDSGCSGYRDAPKPDQLWPGERWGDALPCVHGVSR